jgi:hypothetical protein
VRWEYEIGNECARARIEKRRKRRGEEKKSGNNKSRGNTSFDNYLVVKTCDVCLFLDFSSSSPFLYSLFTIHFRRVINPVCAAAAWWCEKIQIRSTFSCCCCCLHNCFVVWPKNIPLWGWFPLDKIFVNFWEWSAWLESFARRKHNLWWS